MLRTIKIKECLVEKEKYKRRRKIRIKGKVRESQWLSSG
jgi:hypothetical protein